MSEIIIENGIPVPTKRGDNPLSQALLKMEIGQSFYTELERAFVNNTRFYAQQKHGFKYVIRAEGNGCRVWRIK